MQAVPLQAAPLHIAGCATLQAVPLQAMPHCRLCPIAGCAIASCAILQLLSYIIPLPCSCCARSFLCHKAAVHDLDCRLCYCALCAIAGRANAICAIAGRAHCTMLKHRAPALPLRSPALSLTGSTISHIATMQPGLGSPFRRRLCSISSQ